MESNWAITELSSLVDYKKGKKPKRMEKSPFKNSLVYLDIKAIEKNADENFVDPETSNHTDENDLVVVWDGARAGWVGKSRKGAIGSTLMALKPKINKDYLYRFLQTQFQYLQSNHRGTGIPHVDPDIFWNIQVPIAPEGEQEVIAKKLEELITKVERSKTRLEKFPIILKRFRQSVLAAAVSGKLTEEWREKNKIKEEWKEMKASDACETVASGSTPANNPFTTKGDIPFLKVYNIVNQKIDFDYKPQFVTNEIHNTKLKRCKLFPNDIIINIVGPPLGKVALVTDQYPEWNMNQAIVLFRAKDFLLPYFLFYILLEGSEIRRLENEYRGSAGQTNISLTQCRNFIFSIPTTKEQREIIRKVEQLFSLADKIEERFTQVKARMDKLPQGILAKAFRGELAGNVQNEKADINK